MLPCAEIHKKLYGIDLGVFAKIKQFRKALAAECRVAPFWKIGEKISIIVSLISFFVDFDIFSL